MESNKSHHPKTSQEQEQQQLGHDFMNSQCKRYQRDVKSFSALLCDSDSVGITSSITISEPFLPSALCSSLVTYDNNRVPSQKLQVVGLADKATLFF